MSEATCFICQYPRGSNMTGLCNDCGRAFERWNRTASSTHLALMEWVARRTRRFAGNFDRGDVVDLDILLDGRLNGADPAPFVTRLRRIRRKVKKVLGGAR